jgi:hypothetical protein
MSTKTLRKRIALVAVSALGFGLLSTSSAFAVEGDVTAVTAATTASSTQLTVTATLTTATLTTVATTAGQKANLELGVVGLQVIASPDSDLTVGTRIYSDASIAGLVTVTAAGTSVTAGTVTFVFATKVAPAAGLYQFRVFGTTVANKLTTTEAAGVNVNYNPPILTSTELGASTAAGADNNHRVKSIALAVAYPSSRVGTKVSITPSYLAEGIGAGALVANAEKGTLVYILTKPTGSASVLSASTQSILQAGTTTAGATTVAVAASVSSTGTAVTFTPDVAGTYTLTAFHDAGGANADGVLTTGEASKSISVAVAADAPAITITTFGASSITGGNGALIRVNLTNGGVAGSLGASEYFTISATNTGVITGGTTTLTQASFDAYGRAFFNVTNANAATSTISVVGAGSTAIAALSATTAVKYVAATTAVAATYTATTANTSAAYKGTALAVVSGNNLFYDMSKAMSASIVGTNAMVDSSVVKYTVTDGTAGCLTGLASAAYDVAATVTTLKFTASASGAFTTHAPCVAAVAAAVKGTAVTVGTIAIADDSADTFTLKAAPSLVTTTVNVPTSFTQVVGSTVNASAKVTNQFNVAMAGVAVTVTASAASRNYGSFVTKNLVTDASGVVTWSYTDAPPTANSSLTTDTFTVASTLDAANSGGVAADGGLYANTTVTVTNTAATTVTKVSVTGGDTTAGVTATAVTLVDINAGATGAQAGGVTFSAKVTDVNGTIVVGAPVTWTVSGTGAAIKTTFATTYTDSTGVATATTAVYGWIAGQYTVTATSGAITGTGSITFANIATGEERKITSSVTGSVVTAKVVDRFGNPVFGTMVYATKSGLGTFVSGLASGSATTNQAGIAQFAIVGGSADVIVSLINPASAAGAKGSGQSSARAGAVSWNDDAADDTLFATAVLAGTVFTAEAGVGSTLADAGVATAAAVSVVGDTSAADNATAAADAAAEATDAANAATDAANAAAEAADAATAAAQDAADAVAALSTQVSEMVNALKKQITALTNLVIKIQKKVKA